jgi:hypothetical protein
MAGVVAAVSRNASHAVSKPVVERIVLAELAARGGVRPGDPIAVELPDGPRRTLEPV